MRAVLLAVTGKTRRCEMKGGDQSRRDTNGKGSKADGKQGGGEARRR